MLIKQLIHFTKFAGDLKEPQHLTILGVGGVGGVSWTRILTPDSES